LRGRVAIAPIADDSLRRLLDSDGWKVSTAVVVEGIMRLYTSNPKKDTSNLLAGERKSRRAIESLRKDASPLRRLYLEGQDSVIYTLVLNYTIACDRVFWSRANDDSFIKKTVGVQALFDILRKIGADAYSGKDISVEYFEHRLSEAKDLDFSSDEFKNASGSGRTYIRHAIESKIGIAVN
jgi:hypothetical protein